MPVTEAQVLEALRPVQDPELHRSIVDLDPAAVDADRLHQAEIDDRPAQDGFVDRCQGGEDLGLGDGHRLPPEGGTGDFHYLRR